MHWIQISTPTDSDHAERVENAMTSLGALAVTLGDAADQPLFEPAPGATPLWETIQVVGLFEANAPIASITGQLRTLCGSHPCRLKVEILEDKDWSRELMEHFKPIRFGRRLWICPTWTEPPDPGAVNLMLDPGMAFGTGTHPTTGLCLEWLERQALQGSTLIDYGCGSGVLAIAALLLGCRHAWATDIDPQAIAATLRNAALNHVSPNRLEVALPDAISLPVADIVMANILAGPLLELAPELAARCRAGGTIVLSGLLANQAEAVQQAYASWFTIANPLARDGWVLLAGNRVADG